MPFNWSDDCLAARAVGSLITSANAIGHLKKHKTLLSPLLYPRSLIAHVA